MPATETHLLFGLVSRETLVTAFLVWLAIGSLLWVVLDGLGVMTGAYQGKLAAGRRLSACHLVLAIMLAIVAWPLVARQVLLHPRRALSILARNFWGRP